MGGPSSRRGRSGVLEERRPAASPPGRVDLGQIDAIRVALVSDVRIHRDGLAAMLAAAPGVRVVAVVRATPVEVPDEIDVAVLDTTGADGLALVRRWAGTGVALVALGAPRAEEDVLAFAETGVLGFVEREASVEGLIQSITAAASGEASCPPRVATTLLRRIQTPSAVAAKSSVGAVLTAREQQIVQLIAEGLSNKEIAQRLYIEVATVKNHVHNILEKLQVSRRGEAAARLRLVESADPLQARSQLA